MNIIAIIAIIESSSLLLLLLLLLLVLKISTQHVFVEEQKHSEENAVSRNTKIHVTQTKISQNRQEKRTTFKNIQKLFDTLSYAT